MDNATALQKRTNRFLRASELGVIAFVFIVVISEFFDPGDVPFAVRAVVVGAIVIWSASLIVMFFYRNTDEYTQSLWSMGTNASFIAIALLLVFGTFFEQLFYKLYMPERSLNSSYDLAHGYALYVLFFTFFAALHLKRLMAR